ncbi:MAG: sigma-70 family RNA polymerase sigma factor [Bacteroidota bacterium]|nr:sigma-70 family RNA polymerase sigma factor [Bacteroidota bacterium]
MSNYFYSFPAAAAFFLPLARNANDLFYGIKLLPAQFPLPVTCLDYTCKGDAPVKSKEKLTYKIVARKDKEAIALLYERYGKRLYAYATHSWKLSEDESWNLVYKTLYRILNTTAEYSFESEKNYSSFIFKVFVNYLRQYYRDTKKAKEHLEIVNTGEMEEHPEMAAGPKDSFGEETVETSSVKMSLLKEELEKLEDWERMLLLLRSQDMPYAEIAKFVSKPEEQLKVYYARLKAALTKRMNEKLKG